VSTPARSERRGRILLAPLAAEAAAGVLAPPRLPPAAAATVAPARRALAAAFPVLLTAPAAGRLLIARALHALEGRGPFVAAVGRRPDLGSLPAGATLYLDAGALAAEGGLALEALLDEGGIAVVAGLEPGARLPAALAPRLGIAALAVPPLAERRAELASLAAWTLERLAARLGRPVPHLAAAALSDLQTRSWPGDLGELEAVLARALLAAPADEIAPEHLTPDGASSALVERPRPAPPELELLLAELAHELRNPMVTIKTYAQHLPALLDDAELRARFASLCDDAIGRMDGLLENVLAFARLGRPHVETVEVAPLLARVLQDLEPELVTRGVRLRQATAAALRCAADPDQLTYALRNLFAGVAREVPAREELSLDSTVNGVVTLSFAAGGAAAERLRHLVAGDGDAADGGLTDPTLLPLAFRLARAVLEQNGGTLAVLPGAGDTTTVMVRLPTARAEG
jgi:signal transduction histidine kinase